MDRNITRDRVRPVRHDGDLRAGGVAVRRGHVLEARAHRRLPVAAGQSHEIDRLLLEDTLRQSSGTWCLCRCGGSRSKPFCDGTHARIGFDGTESADHGPIADRRDAYAAGDEVTVYDDRRRCAHFGQCSTRLPQVFRADAEPFVDPIAASASDITAVVTGCPSGALAYAFGADLAPVEAGAPSSVRPIVDGPYRVRGDVEVRGADGRSYERRERQTLCRCGQSQNKPFCDGSHWYAGFRDPLPPELSDAPTLPWEDPDAAARGRERYAEEQARGSALESR